MHKALRANKNKDKLVIKKWNKGKASGKELRESHTSGRTKSMRGKSIYKKAYFASFL